MSIATLLNRRVGVADIAKTAMGNRKPPIAGIPLCTGMRSTGLSAAFATAQTVQDCVKWPGIAGFDYSDIRLVYCNWRTNQYSEGTKPYEDVIPEASMTVKPGVSINGVTYEMTVRGSRTAVIEPGGWAITDPLPLEGLAGDVIRTLSYQAAGTWRVYSSIQNPALGGDSAGITTTGDFTADGSAQLADGGGSGVMPAIVVATPKNPAQRSVFISGASDAEGVGDGILGNGFNMAITQPRHGRWGFITRALVGKAGAVMVARTGDRADKFILPAGHKRRLTFASACSDVITTFGINDMNAGGATLAQLKTSKITEWGLYAARGCRVWQTTLTPYTTSTDNWKTTANQTLPTWEASRTGFNDWVRDGAPINYPAMTAATIGATGNGVIRAGATGHPLFSYFEVADAAESARNSGKWKVSQVETRTDCSCVSGSNVYTMPGRTFTSADLWSLYEIAGAGPSGTALRGYVSAFTTNTVTLLTTSGSVVNASATLSGLTASLKLPTVDGAHGTNDLHETMSAAIDTTRLLAA